jgi:hypothetical protein
MAEHFKAQIVQCDNADFTDQGESMAVPEEVIEEVMKSSEFLASTWYKTMAWGKLYDRSCFATLRFPVGKLHEDNAIIYKVVYGVEKVAFTTKKLYYYYQRQDSITGVKYNLRRLDKVEFLREQCDFYEKNGERELLRKAQIEYLYLLLEQYGFVYRYYHDEKNILSDLLKEYRKTYQKVKIYIPVKKTVKLLLVVSYIRPELWNKMLHIEMDK